MSYFGSRAIAVSLLCRRGDSILSTAPSRRKREGAGVPPPLWQVVSGRGDRGCFRSGHFVRQLWCLLTPVRHLLVLDDSAEQEEKQGDGEDGEADDLLFRAAIDGPAAGDLEPADTDDA